MLYFVVTRAHAYTLRIFLETWGRSLSRRFRTIPYEDLFFLRELPRGAYLFADLERLSPDQLLAAKHIHGRLTADGVRCLNDPNRSLRRHDLLKMLHHEGVNSFNVHRLPEGLDAARLPAFIRHDDAHDGNLTPLLHTREALRDAFDALRQAGENPARLLAVEYRETADAAGIYRKYGAMRIGNRIIPRHILFSGNWMLKFSDRTNPEFMAEELQYHDANPHETELRRIFDLAGIEYGRIDYAMHDGRIEVWEINTNPMILVSPADIAEPRLAGQKQSYVKMKTAFEELDPGDAPGHIRLRLPPDLARALGDRPMPRAFRAAGRMLRSLKRVRLLKPIKDKLKRTIRIVRLNAQEPSELGRTR